MSEASLNRRIAAIAVPAMLTVAAEPLYDLTDTAILGRLGTAQLGGAALAVAVLGLGYAVFIFLMFGTTGSVARLLGAGDPRAAVHRGVGALWLGAGLGVVAALVLWPAAVPLLRLFGGRGRVLTEATTYFTVSLWGFPAFLVVMAGAGYLRGTADTRTPLLIALVSVALNLVGEVVLIIGLGFGVGASAGTTVAAKTFGAALYVVLVARAARHHRVPLGPDREVIAELGRAGWPLFIRTASLRLALAVAYGTATGLGTVSLAAWAIVLQLWSFLAYVTDGLEVAGQALVGAAVGARDRESLRRIASRILLWACGLGAALGVGVIGLHRVLPELFTHDAAVVELAAGVLVWVGVTQPVNAVAFALDGILVGADDLWFQAVAMTGAMVAFVPLAWWASSSAATLGALYAAWSAFMVLRVVLLGTRLSAQLARQRAGFRAVTR